MARRKESGAPSPGNDEPLQDLAVLFERYRVPHWSRAACRSSRAGLPESAWRNGSSWPGSDSTCRWPALRRPSRTSWRPSTRCSR